MTTTWSFEITDDMIEAGAQAIRVALMRIPPRKDWSGVSAGAKDAFRMEARACLIAALSVAERNEASR